MPPAQMDGRTLLASPRPTVLYLPPWKKKRSTDISKGKCLRNSLGQQNDSKNVRCSVVNLKMILFLGAHTLLEKLEETQILK
jgi:hypothetical protein